MPFLDITIPLGQAQDKPSKKPITQRPRPTQSDPGMVEELEVTIAGFVCRSDTATDRPIKFKRPKFESLPCGVRVEIGEVRSKSFASVPSTNSAFLDARRLPCEIQHGLLELSNTEYEFRLQSFQPFRFDGRSLHINHYPGSAKQSWKRSLATEYDVRLTVLFQEQPHFAKALQHVGLEVPMEESYLGARILIKTDSPRQTRYGRAYLLRAETTVSTHLELVTNIAWKRPATSEGMPPTIAALNLDGYKAAVPSQSTNPAKNGAKTTVAGAIQLDAETRIQKAWDIGLEDLCKLFDNDKVLWNKESFCDLLARLAEMTTRDDADKLLRQFYCARKHVAFASEYSHCLRSAPRHKDTRTEGSKSVFKPASWYKDIELKDVEAAIAKRESERRKAAKFHQRSQSSTQETGPLQGSIHDKNNSPMAVKVKGEAGKVLNEITPGRPAKLRQRGVLPSSHHKAVVPGTPESVEERSESAQGTRLKLSVDSVQAITRSTSDSAVELDKLPAKLHGVKIGGELHDLSEMESSIIAKAYRKRAWPQKVKTVDWAEAFQPGATLSKKSRKSSNTGDRNDYGLPLPVLTPYTVPTLDDPELSLFKCVTMRRLAPGSQVVEYDEQIDETWYRMKLDQKINVNTKMSPRQKTLMKLWNNKMLEEKLNGNKFLPAALLRFVTANHVWLAVLENFQQFLRFVGELRRDKLVPDDILQQCINETQSQVLDPYVSYEFKFDRGPDECRSEWAMSCSCGEQIDDVSQSVICSNPVS